MGEGQRDGVGAALARAVVLATGGLGQVFSRPPTRPCPPATASRSRCAPVPWSPTSSSSSSTRPCSGSAPGARASSRWSPRRCAARAPCWSTTPASLHAGRAPDGRPRPARRRRQGDHARGCGRPGTDHVLAGRRHLGGDFLGAALPHHPRVAAARTGIDPVTDLIPVAPAQHYASGGVAHRPRRPHRRSRVSTRAARSPAPACTAPTGSRPTPCSRGWCSPSGSPTTSPTAWPLGLPRRRPAARGPRRSRRDRAHRASGDDRGHGAARWPHGVDGRRAGRDRRGRRLGRGRRRRAPGGSRRGRSPGRRPTCSRRPAATAVALPARRPAAATRARTSPSATTPLRRPHPGAPHHRWRGRDDVQPLGSAAEDLLAATHGSTPQEGPDDHRGRPLPRSAARRRPGSPSTRTSAASRCRTSPPPPPSPRTARHRRLVARAAGVVAGLPLAAACSGPSRTIAVDLLPARSDGDLVRGATSWPSVSGLHPGRCSPASGRPLNLLSRAVRHRDAHPALGRRARGHRRDGARHPQDHAWAAGAGEVRRALRRRHQQAHGPVRRGDDQGQPHARGRLARGGVRRCPRRRPGVTIQVEVDRRSPRRSRRSRPGRGSCSGQHGGRPAARHGPGGARHRRAGRLEATGGLTLAVAPATPRPASTTSAWAALTHSSPIWTSPSTWCRRADPAAQRRRRR